MKGLLPAESVLNGLRALNPPVNAATFWAERWAQVQPSWAHEAEHIIRTAATRRSVAKFNTGSISQTAALTLRAICAWAAPRVIIEVGTFIGVSTLSLRADQIYTCDVSNDCLPSGRGISCFPYQTSTQMLQQLAERNVTADLCFFDGLLTPEDAGLLAQVTHTQTVYVFDDYNGQFKGVQNVKRLEPLLPHHVLFPPAGPVADDTTLAVLAPESML